MSWFADLAGKAENLLNNIDEQTGAALRNHSVVKSKKLDKHDHNLQQDPPWVQKKRPTARSVKKVSTATETKSSNFAPTRKPSPISHVNTRQTRSPVKETQEYVNRAPRKKSPVRKPNTQFSLNHCPKTLVGDIRDTEVEDHFGLKQRSKFLLISICSYFKTLLFIKLNGYQNDLAMKNCRRITPHPFFHRCHKRRQKYKQL
jgi:hypothetical protein